MSSYLLIESRDPYDFKGTDDTYELATNLAGKGHDVTLFLIQNGVLPVRKKASNDTLLAAKKSGIKVFADDFSLRERAIPSSDVCEGVSAAGLDLVIDKLASGTKTLWF